MITVCQYHHDEIEFKYGPFIAVRRPLSCASYYGRDYRVEVRNPDGKGSRLLLPEELEDKRGWYSLEEITPIIEALNSSYLVM